MDEAIKIHHHHQRKTKGASEVNSKTLQVYSKMGSIIICEISGHKSLIQLIGNEASGKNFPESSSGSFFIQLTPNSNACGEVGELLFK